MPAPGASGAVIARARLQRANNADSPGRGSRNMVPTMFVLLDDAESTKTDPRSRLFTDAVRHWRIIKTEGIEIALQEMQSAQGHGLYVVALFSYELGEHLQGLNPRNTRTPLIEAFAFNKCATLSHAAVSEWIDASVEPLAAPAGLLDVATSISKERYTQDIFAIQRLISSGDTYQVNHTFRLKGTTFGHPLTLYRELRKQQPVRFGAYIDTGARKILSFSPELFLQLDRGVVTAMPMKGTLGANQGSAQDLALSGKDHAENLMITDLIRNDLGRICKTGSIQVPKLFEVQQVGQVYQMTSTVTGSMRPDVGLSALLSATYPCGSVTGAPKQRTMQIIRELEQEPRELYCGSIACFDPSGDFRMNVAIRTLELDENHRFEMGIGSGVTIDSDADHEWQECMVKAGFVTSLPSPVGLIETMRYQNGQVPLLTPHLDRMHSSAQSLRIPFDRRHVEASIAGYLSREIFNDKVLALRLELQADGELRISHRPIEPVTTNSTIFFAKDLIGESAAVMDSRNPLLRHKTTWRKAYDDAWQAAVAKGGFDAVFTNERGEITEGGRSSLFALIDRHWRTPSEQCGVLPGVMRQKILADPAWCVTECLLTPADLERAEQIRMVNALRGVVEVRLYKI